MKIDSNIQLSNQSAIMVRGNHTEMLEPDSMIITFTMREVKEFRGDDTIVKETFESIMKNLKERINSLQLENYELHLQSLSYPPEYAYNRRIHDKNTIRRYELELPTVENLEEILNTIKTIRGVQPPQVYFNYENGIDKAEDDGISMAILNAGKKGKKLAHSLNMKLGKIKRIIECESTQSARYGYVSKGVIQKSEKMRLPVTYKVVVTYLLAE